MSANGLETFDRSIHATNLWLKEISKEIGVDRRMAWRALGVVLRALRDRLTGEDAAHLAAQLPLVVRGAFYEQYRPAIQPDPMRSREEFVARVADGLAGGGKPMDPERAIRAVFSIIQRHIAEDSWPWEGPADRIERQVQERLVRLCNEFEQGWLPLPEVDQVR